MDYQQRRAELIQRLSTAGAAHGEYEAIALHGVYDSEWAEWYAHFLITHGWNDLFERTWTETELTDALCCANDAHSSTAWSSPWQEFYAERFLEI